MSIFSIIESIIKLIKAINDVINTRKDTISTLYYNIGYNVHLPEITDTRNNDQLPDPIISGQGWVKPCLSTSSSLSLSTCNLNWT